ncbi:MAG TPA: patatin-like phospholipase family protein [Rectinemataceae bacterium]|nr:patatin-like phospholipase family protein [Rectinemataceae bacterium]
MKVGIALGSGGARGIAHIAYLEVLDQLRIGVARISGSSMGALVGAFYAAGMSAARIRDLTTGIGLRDIPKLLDLSGPRDSGIVKGHKIENWIADNLPVKRFEELRMPLRIVATDFWRREQVVFESGELVPAIRASISIPGLFEPYIIDGRLLVDGGVVNPVPFDQLGEADFAVGVDVGGDSDPEESRDPGRIEILLGAYAIMGKIIMEQRAADRRLAMYLRPPVGRFRTLDFLKAKEILDAVRDDAEAFRLELMRRKVDQKARLPV